MVYHQQNIRKRTSEIGSVDVVTLFLGNVHLLTLRAIYFDP